MNTAIVVFDGVTALDAVGPYEVLSRVPGAEVVFVAKEAGPKRTESKSLALHADKTPEDVSTADILLVPGGLGTRKGTNPPISDPDLLGWIRAIDQTTQWTTSVCTGSLVLAAAGLLSGRSATTHWLQRDRLGELGANVLSERVVYDGKLVTAAGVSAGIDMALSLVQREFGDQVAKAIQLSIEYDPEPPFDTGSPDKAPAETVEQVRAGARKAGER
jgi:transcriptional regulator GlxA family with amidase domain